jgi:branched-chain amino acid transport system substrate-binding protein
VRSASAAKWHGLVTLGVLLAACPAVHADILIGVAVPTSGPKVELGRDIHTSAERWLAQYGVHAREPVRLLIEDDACSTEGGAAVAAKFVAAGVALVIGHPCSNAAISAAKVYASANVVFAAIGPTHPELTTKRAGPTIFRMSGRDDRQAADTVTALVEWATGSSGKRIAIVQDRTAYAKGLADGVAAGLRKAGITNISVEPIVAGEKDYSTLIAKLKSDDVELIYFAGFHTEAMIIAAHLKVATPTVRFFGSDAVGAEAIDVERVGHINIMRLMRPTDAATVISSWIGARPADSAALQDAFKTDANGDRLGGSFTAARARRK